MKTKIYNLIILDASGSMISIKKQAIDGVNETVQTIRAAQNKYDNQEHFVTLVSFNGSETKKLYNCKSVLKVKELEPDEYVPDCTTPLYDAMGFSITELKKRLEEGDKVLVTVITDGYENASKEYDCKAVETLVDKLQKEGWVFSYIGANQDAGEVGHSVGIQNCLDFSSTSDGTVAMFAREKRARSRFFERLANSGNEVTACMAEDYFDEVKDE